MERNIEHELIKQMAERRLRFNVESAAELEEVLEESGEYIADAYERIPGDAAKVQAYLDETMKNYPEHIEPIREYILPIAA
jgi:hypothetical protein